MSDDPKKTDRTRFAAVAEEMFGEIEPVKKPPVSDTGYSAEQPLFRRGAFSALFEETVRVVGGAVQPCPRCNASAWTVNEAKDHATCRGCPLPAPVYLLDFFDKSIFVTEPYSCCSCGERSMVTLTISEANLYCGGVGCKKLTLHQNLKERSETKAPVRPGGYAIDLIEGTRVLVEPGPANTVTTVVPMEEAFELFLGDEPLRSTVDALRRLVYEANYVCPDDVVTVEEDPSSPNVTFTIVPNRPNPLTEEGRYEIKAAVGAMLEPSRPAGIGFTVVVSGGSEIELHDRIVEGMRCELILLPFREYADQIRQQNRDRDLKPSDWNRRTGRTTRELIQAVAWCVVKRVETLYVSARTQSYERDLCRRAAELRETGARRGRKLVHPTRVKPLSKNPRVACTPPRGWLYVDHSVDERFGLPGTTSR